MTIKTALAFLFATSAIAGLSGCSGSSSSTEAPGTTRASLHRAKSCGDLLVDLKADAAFKVNHAIDRQIQSIQKCIEVNGDANCAYGGWGYASSGSAEDAALGGAPTASPNAPPQSGASSSSGGTGAASDSGSRAGSYSETNVQVKGVDEADIVKTDGQNLYVIHGSTLKVVKAWPANELAELTSTQIEGSPSEMFVANGKAVVYSTVNGAAIFTAAGVQPKPQYNEYGYPVPGGAARSSADVAAPYPYPGGSSGPYYPLTKITVLDMGGAAPSVTREIYFEGSYLDSRRVNDQVRTVLQNPAHGPKLIGSIYELYAPKATDPSSSSSSSSGGSSGTVDPWGGTTTNDPYPKTGTQAIQALQQLKAENKKIIDASQLGDWIPYTFVKEGAAIRAQTVACEDFYVPTVGSTEAGMTEVVSIDLSKPGQPPRETAILGHAETVYGSADTLYIAASGWVETPFAWSNGGAVGGGDVAVAPPPSTEAAPAPAPIGTQTIRPKATPPGGAVTAWPTNKTHVHKFEFASDPGFPNYVASGTVSGSVKNQFSLDDKDGYLRIATTENRLYVDGAGNYVSPDFGDPKTTTVVNPNTVNRLYVMKVNGPWLDVVGDAGALAPNEQIYSARFVGGRGYIVTFRRVDPLFVFDLTMPTNPQKLAELTIPGFSEYMHPLGETHLLTIGRDASTDGRVRGLQLKIFDVSNGAMPKVAQEYTYASSNYGQSEAEYDHKAFTYFDDKKLLAFPYYSYSNTDGSMRSSLEIFRVDAATGFQMLGSIDHTSLVSKAPTGYSCGYYGPQVRRGVFLESFVYSISYGGIVVKNTADMTAPGTSLALPQPIANDGYGPVCDAVPADGGF